MNGSKINEMYVQQKYKERKYDQTENKFWVKFCLKGKKWNFAVKKLAQKFQSLVKSNITSMNEHFILLSVHNCVTVQKFITREDFKSAFNDYLIFIDEIWVKYIVGCRGVVQFGGLVLGSHW